MRAEHRGGPPVLHGDHVEQARENAAVVHRARAGLVVHDRVQQREQRLEPAELRALARRRVDVLRRLDEAQADGHVRVAVAALRLRVAAAARRGRREQRGHALPHEARHEAGVVPLRDAELLQHVRVARDEAVRHRARAALQREQIAQDVHREHAQLQRRRRRRGRRRPQKADELVDELRLRGEVVAERDAVRVRVDGREERAQAAEHAAAARLARVELAREADAAEQREVLHLRHAPLRHEPLEELRGGAREQLGLAQLHARHALLAARVAVELELEPAAEGGQLRPRVGHRVQQAEALAAATPALREAEQLHRQRRLAHGRIVEGAVEGVLVEVPVEGRPHGERGDHLERRLGHLLGARAQQVRKVLHRVVHALLHRVAQQQAGEAQRREQVGLRRSRERRKGLVRVRVARRRRVLVRHEDQRRVVAQDAADAAVQRVQHVDPLREVDQPLRRPRREAAQHLDEAIRPRRLRHDALSQLRLPALGRHGAWNAHPPRIGSSRGERAAPRCAAAKGFARGRLGGACSQQPAGEGGRSGASRGAQQIPRPLRAPWHAEAAGRAAARSGARTAWRPDRSGALSRRGAHSGGRRCGSEGLPGTEARAPASGGGDRRW